MLTYLPRQEIIHLNINRFAPKMLLHFHIFLSNNISLFKIEKLNTDLKKKIHHPPGCFFIDINLKGLCKENKAPLSLL